MAFDFPNSPSPGQTYTVAGITYVWDGLAWSVATNPQMFLTARLKNITCNSSFQITQENVRNVGTASGYYSADQWFCTFSGLTTGTANWSSVVLNVLPPSGARYALCMQVTAAQASPAAAVWSGYVQNVEGYDLEELMWGTPYAIPAVARFLVLANHVGTYAFVLRSSGSPVRTFSKLFTIPAINVWTEIVIPIPADFTAGSYQVTVNTKAMEIWFTFASGTSQQQANEGWNTAAVVGVAGQSNIYAANGNTVYITEIGLYADPDNTGRAPRYQVPDFTSEYNRCQRYYENLNLTDLFMLTRVDGGSQMGAVWYFMASKRVAPTVTFTNSGTGISAYMPVINGVEFLCSVMQTAAVMSAKANARMT